MCSATSNYVWTKWAPYGTYHGVQFSQSRLSQRWPLDVCTGSRDAIDLDQINVDVNVNCWRPQPQFRNNEELATIHLWHSSPLLESHLHTTREGIISQDSADKDGGWEGRCKFERYLDFSFFWNDSRFILGFFVFQFFSFVLLKYLRVFLGIPWEYFFGFLFFVFWVI